MVRKMILSIILLITVLALFLLYSMVKIRYTATVLPPRPALEKDQHLRNLYAHVDYLSNKIGSRSVFEHHNIEATKDYIVSRLKEFGYTPELQSFPYEGKEYSNVIASIKGTVRPDETVVIGAHYDTVFGTPGADDNASAIAVLLEMCRILKNFSPERTLKLIFFVFEEPPMFRTEYMGSFVFVKEAKRRNENIIAMLSLEMLGYYSEKKGGQSFPLPLMSLMFSTTPDFIAVVGNLQSRNLVKKVRDAIRECSGISVETLSTVSFVPGVDFSDHRSFWKMGYPAVMITDTAFYRNPNYHTENDTIHTLNFEKMCDLLHGLVNVARRLTSSG